MSGAAQSALRLIWRMGFIVFPVLYPAWDAAQQAKSCRVLWGSASPLLSPSLFSASQGEIFFSCGFTVGPWLLGERPHHMWCRWGAHKASKDVFVWDQAFVGWVPALPASWHNFSPKGMYAVPLWAFRFSDFSVFCTDRCLMLRWKSSSCTFKAVLS